MPLSRTQRDILKAMHRIRKPTTVNEIAKVSHISWITVKNNLEILQRHNLVILQKRTLRKTWVVNYAMFDG
ncbi:MAG: helix-turn-helix transcriptional regulator [Candidatus Aenigmarchaeota archaeon]|nr:helix-turn-helix transcriptional regulator [Candidatus Aenigmarchaeota archaeon]